MGAAGKQRSTSMCIGIDKPEVEAAISAFQPSADLMGNLKSLKKIQIHLLLIHGDNLISSICLKPVSD